MEVQLASRHEKPVSGLMLVAAGQEALAAMAAWDFLISEGAEDRELVVVGNLAAAQAVNAAARRGLTVTHVAAESGLSASDKWVKGISAARGEHLCVWNAADRHSADRLSRQLEASAASQGLSSALTSAIYVFPVEKKAFLLDFRLGPTTGTGGFIPTTLCFRRAAARGLTSAILGESPDRGLFEYVSRCSKCSSPKDTSPAYVRVCTGREAIAGQPRRTEATKHGLTAAQLKPKLAEVVRMLQGFGLHNLSICDASGTVLANSGDPNNGRMSGDGLPSKR